jgi:hypothetical protein
LIPKAKIRAIRGYRISSKRHANSYGTCIKERNGQFTINMRLYKWDKNSKQHVGLYLGFLLETFAHELAHCLKDCFEHTPKHVKYTGIILSRFAKVLEKNKITDTFKRRMDYE